MARDLRDHFFAAVDVSEGVRHYHPRHPGGLSAARCRFVGDLFKSGDDDDPKFGEYVADRAGDIGGGNVAVVEALIVAALLDVADAAANLGQLLSEIQLHGSFGSRAVGRVSRWAERSVCCFRREQLKRRAVSWKGLSLTSVGSIFWLHFFRISVLLVRLLFFQGSLQ